MRHVVLFLFALGVWNLLVWPIDAQGAFMVRDFLFGVIASIVVAFFMREVATQRFHRIISPIRIFWFFVFLIVLSGNMIKALVDMTYRTLHPDMPLLPGILKLTTTLATPSAITMLANAITLTSGTHTIDATSNGVIYVHWLNVTSIDQERANAIIIGRFERILKRVFE